VQRKRKILVVDDEPINLEFFEVMLTRLGFAVEKAADGEEALRKVRAGSPDLILLDNMMPKLSGWEVTRVLKRDAEYRRWRDVPVIMLSAMSDVKDRIGGFELGVDDYISKPFNFAEVLARVRAVLRGRELAEQLVRREKRIAVAESLGRSLVFFTQHIRKPAADLLARSERTDASDPAAVKGLLRAVRRETREILATLGGLEDKVQELASRGERLARGDLSLEDLEQRLASRLQEWKRHDGGAGGHSSDQ
jgi:DNA-binding response OmpR family regulator